jgi:hypothetical protein
MESKPRKQFTLKKKEPVAETPTEALAPSAPSASAANAVPKVRKVFVLKKKIVESGPATVPDTRSTTSSSGPRRFTVRQKKPRWAMTAEEELEEDVRTWYLMHGEGKIPEDERAFLDAMKAADAEAREVYLPAPDAALAWELMLEYPNFWHHDFVPPADDPRFAELEAIQKGLPPPKPLTELQKEALDDAVPPPHGTKEFWAWINRRKARINKERAEKGLPPLPTKKEKEAAAAKKKAEKEAAKAEKEKAKAAKVAAKLAKASK